jgi:citrate synthase
LSKETEIPEEDLHWQSSISQLKFGSIGVRGYKVADLIGRISFTEMIWLVTMGELPSPAVARVMDAVLVSAAEGGGRSPSVLAARTVASCGAPITAAVAAGSLAISKYHGGAVEDCMRQLISIRKEVAAGTAPLEAACRQAVRRRLDQGERLSGFGHRVHKEVDPRMDKLFEVTREAGFPGEYLDLVAAVARALEAETGKRLPVNIDGADAAVLCEIAFPPELSNPLWMLARSVGMIAHAHEEQTRMRPRRYIHPTDWEYDGPPEREL